jgi:hypothetical protein
MIEQVINKLEQEKVKNSFIPAPAQVIAESKPKEVQDEPEIDDHSDNNVVTESQPTKVVKTSFKEKVKRLQKASNIVRKPVKVEVKKNRKIVELW